MKNEHINKNVIASEIINIDYGQLHYYKFPYPSPYYARCQMILISTNIYIYIKGNDIYTFMMQTN